MEQVNLNVETEGDKEKTKGSVDLLKLTDFDPSDVGDKGYSVDHKDLSDVFPVDEKLSKNPKNPCDEKSSNFPNNHADVKLPKIPKDPVDEKPSNFPNNHVDAKPSKNPKDLSDENVSNISKDSGDEQLTKNPKNPCDEKPSNFPNNHVDAKPSKNPKDLSDENVSNISKDSGDEQFTKSPKNPADDKIVCQKDLGDEKQSQKLKDLGDEKLFQSLSFEDKVNILLDKFRTFPKSTIRHVLWKDDDKGDLDAAFICLKTISEGEGTFSKAQHEEGNRNVLPKGIEAGRQDLSIKVTQKNNMGKINESKEHKTKESEDSSKLEDLNNPKEMPPSKGSLGCRQEASGTNKEQKPTVWPKENINSCKGHNDSRKRAESHASADAGPTLQGVENEDFQTFKENQSDTFEREELDMTQSSSVKNTSTPKKRDSRELGQKENTKPSHLKTFKQFSNFEQTMMLLRGLIKATSYESITKFVEAITKEKVLVILKSDNETSALVIFENIIDFENAREKMESCSLDGRKVTVHRVPISWGVSIQHEEETVTFKDPDVMQKFLSSSAKLNDEELNLEMFDSPFQECTLGHHSQYDIAVAGDKGIIEFISATDSFTELKKSLKVHGFTMKYSSGDSVVYIVPESAKGSAVDKERGIKYVTDFTKKFKAIELEVDKNHWDTVIMEIYKLHKEIGKDKLLVKECASKEKITIVCREDDSKELEKTFMDKIGETQSLQDEKAHEMNAMEIEKEKLRLLQIIGYKEELLSDYFDLKVDIDEANGKFTISGPRKQCNEARVKIYRDVSKFCEKQVTLPECITELPNLKEVFERMGTRPGLLCYYKKIYAVFHINEGNIFVIGINKNHADQASDILKSLITEVKIEVKQEAKDVIEEKWNDFCKEVRQKFRVCVRRCDDSNICITGMKEDVSSTQETIRKLLDDNSLKTGLYCSSDKEVRRYIFEHRKEELAKMEKDYSVRISADEEELDKVLINGAKVGCALAQEALQSLEDSVSTKKMKVQQPGLHKLATSGKLDSLVRKIEHEHKCAIAKGGYMQLQGSNDSNDAASQAMFSIASSATDGFESEKCGNVTILWKPGSIVTEHVSIQVGSTIGKLFNIFIEAGGPVFSEEITKYVKLSDCVITSKAGNLPCDHVILTSCCKWDGGKGEAETKLRSIVRVCLQEALNRNATSIAFPIIGTGRLGFPYDKACQIMISEVIKVTCQWEPTSLNDIRFVVFDQDSTLVNEFRQEFTMAFNHTTVHETRGIGSSLTSIWNFLGKSNRRIPSSQIKNDFGKVAVEVLQGDLISEKTDAILNINATNMNMQKAGALSKAIAAAAGPAVQTECTELGPQPGGSAVITGAGKLKVKKIIHMIPGESSAQHIQKCIEICLQTAERSGFESISIPACGTGGFNMSAVDSAQATFQALANVCSKFKHLKQIRIVIFQSKFLPAFKKKLGEYETGAPNKTESVKLGKPLKNKGETRNVDKATTATIELSVYGKSKEVVDEAIAEITRELTEACKTRTIEDQNISRLSEDQRKGLTEKANDLGVEIKFDDSMQHIEFRGNPADVMEIHDQSWKEIQKVQQDKDVIPLPEEWCPMPKKKGKEETVHLVSLGEGSSEYQIVLKMFEATGGTGSIMKIERIQNPHLYQQYMLYKRKIDKDNAEKNNERQLFHGTAGKNVNDINTRGFNRIFRGSHVGCRFGEGVYFAKNASYSVNYTSPDASKNRHIYVARVLVGKHTLGSSKMKVPPENPKTGTPFDSTANKKGPDADIFVVFYDSQCYPQYLITFQKDS